MFVILIISMAWAVLERDSGGTVFLYPNGQAKSKGFTIYTDGNIDHGGRRVINADGSWGGLNSGLVGSTGPQGPRGYTGPAGANGSQGAKGSTGATGIQGVKGSTGTAGGTGTQGPRGYTGPAGSNGIQGVKGSTGTAGGTGTQGPRGSTGTNGTNGVKGSTGATGAAPFSLSGTHGVFTQSNSSTTGTDGAFIDINNSAGTNGAYSGIRFQNGSSASTYKGGIFYKDTGGYGLGHLIFANDPNSAAGNVDAADARMTIAYNGNIGIGTTNPTYKLHVASGGIKFPDGTTQTTAGGGGGGYTAGDTILVSNGTVSAPGLAFNSDTDSGMYRIDNTRLGFSVFGNNHLTIKTNYDGTAGYVGIGDTNPAFPLTVRSGSGTIVADGTILGSNHNVSARGSASQPAFGINSYGGVGMYFPEANNDSLGLVADGSEILRLRKGNVGIGTTNPTDALHLDGKSMTIDDGGSSTYYLMLRGGGAPIAKFGEADDILNGGSAGSLGISSFGDIQLGGDMFVGPIMTIDTSLKTVGIGTTNPTYKLHVDGYVRATGFKGGISPVDMKVTLTSHDGKFWVIGSPASCVDAGITGNNPYQCMNNWIQANGCSGYHVCTASEVAMAVQYGLTIPGSGSSWITTFTGVGDGGGDCGGWLQNGSAYKGRAIYTWESQGWNYPLTLACSATAKVTCCK